MLFNFNKLMTLSCLAIGIATFTTPAQATSCNVAKSYYVSLNFDATAVKKMPVKVTALIGLATEGYDYSHKLEESFMQDFKMMDLTRDANAFTGKVKLSGISWFTSGPSTKMIGAQVQFLVTAYDKTVYVTEKTVLADSLEYDLTSATTNHGKPEFEKALQEFNANPVGDLSNSFSVVERSGC